jgi:hypothetical protein
VNAWARLGLAFLALVLAALFLKQLPAIIVLALLVGGFGLMNTRLRPRGAREPAAVDAGALGLEHAAEDPFDLAELPLILFDRGSEPKVSDVLYGTWRGLEVRTFGLSIEIELPSGERARRRFTCATAPTTATSRVVIEPLAFLLPFPATAPDAVRLDAPELATTYTVRSDDPTLARSILEGRLRRWLAGNEERWGFELSGGALVAYRPVQRAGDALEALETVRAFLDRVPPESRSAPRG